jgi:hypothetical protein
VANGSVYDVSTNSGEAKTLTCATAFAIAADSTSIDFTESQTVYAIPR